MALYDAGQASHLHWLWSAWAERTGNFLTVLALALLAFAMIWTSRQIRGRTIICPTLFSLWFCSISDRHKCFASDIVPRAAKLDVILRNFKANGIGIFREIRDDPPFQIETLDPKDAALDGMILHDGIASSAVGSKGMSSLTFVLPKPRRIYAVHLRYAYVKTGSNWPKLRAYWRNSAVQEVQQ